MASIVTPENKLKQKVGDGGFNEKDIEAAQSAIDECDIDFTPIADNYLSELALVVQNSTEESFSSDMKSYALDNLVQLRAQGSFFGYASITQITDIIVYFLDSKKHLEPEAKKIITAYERAIRTLLREEIKEESHAICKTFSEEFKEVCKRYNKKFTDN